MVETMSTVTAIDVKKYSRLLSRTLPQLIETKGEYERLLGEAKSLMERDEETLSPEEITLLDLLVHLLEEYEEKRFPIRPAAPHDVLHHLMEARGLTHKDVWRLFGSKGIASEVLNRKRGISKMHAKRLAEFFHVSAELFI
jgi:HTH-type transcriptional regulator / antitoxin HigA